SFPTRRSSDLLRLLVGLVIRRRQHGNQPRARLLTRTGRGLLAITAVAIPIRIAVVPTGLAHGTGVRVAPRRNHAIYLYIKCQRSVVSTLDTQPPQRHRGFEA